MGSIDVAAAFHAQRHAKGGPDAITPESIGVTPESIGAAESRYSVGPDALFDNPFLRESLGGWAGSGWSWVATGGVIFNGVGGFSGKMDVTPGTTVTMNAFVMPHPTITGGGPVQLSIQKTAMGGSNFSYEGVYAATTERTEIPPQGINLRATFTVDTDGFRVRVDRGAGHLVSLTITKGNVAPSPFYAPDTTLYGVGSPETTTQAPYGTEYIDTAKTNGARKWLKETAGTTTVGWRVIEGDTGWRNVTGLIPAGILDPDAPGRLLLRRVGQTVHIKADSIKPAADSTSRVDLLDGTLPVHFRPSAIHEQGRFTRSNGVTTVYNVTVWSSSRFGIVSRASLGHASVEQGWFATDALVGSMTYITDTAWPTSLPGTPA